MSHICVMTAEPVKLPASVFTIRSKMRALLCPQHFLHYKSMGKIFGAQGQVTPKQIVRSGPKSNRLRFYACLVVCIFEEDPIKTGGAIWFTIFFGTQGQVTPTSVDGCGGNSNSPEILWLYWLPASVITIRSEMRALLCPQHFLHYKHGKKLGAQGQVTSKWIVRFNPKSNSSDGDCISVLVTCKFEEHPIKSDGAIVSTTFSPL